MKKVFINSTGTQCIFTDDMMAFMDAREDVFYPYGSLDTLRMNLLGDVEAIGGVSICCFRAEKEDRAEMRKMIQFAKKKMKEARKSGDSAKMLAVKLGKRTRENWIPADLSEEEKLHCYQTLFVKGSITREEYQFRKQLLQAAEE